jgi:hypothetical protein
MSDRIKEALEMDARLMRAIQALYYSAHWYPDRVIDADALWTELRDAAGLTPGRSIEILGTPRGPVFANKEWVKEQDRKRYG